MLQIECHKCRQRFVVKGHTTSDSYYEPGEVIISDDETFDECCECVKDGGEYDVVAEEIDHCDDDVI